MDLRLGLNLTAEGGGSSTTTIFNFTSGDSGGNYAYTQGGIGALSPTTFHGYTIKYFGSFGIKWFRVEMDKIPGVDSIFITIDGQKFNLYWEANVYHGSTNPLDLSVYFGTTIGLGVPVDVVLSLS